MNLTGVFALFGFPEDNGDNKWEQQKKELEDFKKQLISRSVCLKN
jgi:hypothetical protein